MRSSTARYLKGFPCVCTCGCIYLQYYVVPWSSCFKMCVNVSSSSYSFLKPHKNGVGYIKFYNWNHGSYIKVLNRNLNNWNFNLRKAGCNINNLISDNYAMRKASIMLTWFPSTFPDTWRFIVSFFFFTWVLILVYFLWF